MDSKEKPGNIKAKGYYLLFSSINTLSPDGIEKKILCQKKLFEELGIQMEFKVLKKQNGTFWNDIEGFDGVDFIYFRKSTIVDWRFIRFFKRLKRKSCPIVFMEIPTYPYEGEFGKGKLLKLRLAIDRLFRKKLKGLIDRIVVTGFDVGAYLWQIPALCVVNGIDLSSVRPRVSVEHKGVILGCIAKFSPWHGYERIIKGLADYYVQGPQKDVRILMVGDGPEKSYYEALVKDLGIADYVKFTGKLSGEALDVVYETIDVGICSLGRYKSGINVIGDLKSREFMAKGIPMVCGCQIDVLQGENYPFVYYVPNDESMIKINEVVLFYERILNTFGDNMTSKIRKEAERLVDFPSTYQKVLKCAKETLWTRGRERDYSGFRD